MTWGMSVQHAAQWLVYAIGNYYFNILKT